MKMKKIISAAIAATMLLTSLGLSAFAATEPVEIENYVSTEYKTQAEKVATMTLMYSEGNYKMYVDTKSGEFALQNVKTGEYTFSNPYDVAVNTETTEDQKQALMSQIILSYSENETNSMSVLNSFKSAALNGNQITFKTMANGIRAEYAIGTVESKRLIPRQIEFDRFYTKIYEILKLRVSDMTKDEKFIFDHLLDTYYKLIDQTDPDNASLVSSWRDNYPALDNNNSMVMFVLSQSDNRSLRNVENLIRKFCPQYTYDELEYDHELTMYEGDEKEPPLFRMAIEYSIVDGRFRASIPAKSIRYNETNYSLESITLLPYFGCTTTKSTGNIKRTGGYIFIPDGSGTILEYYDEDGTAKSNKSQGAPIYGIDYTYDKINKTTSSVETYRMPVFGLTEYYTETVTTERTGRPAFSEDVNRKRGYFAIITEGESFATILANIGSITGVTGGGSSEYSYACATFSTRQSDTVNLGSSLSADKGLSTSVDTKYLGNYSLEFVLLSDPELSKQAGVKDAYAPSYVGMADAYRDYLIGIGDMQRLEADELESSLPLYIQSFGYVEVQENILTFPVTVKKPLTTFEDIIQMSETLKESSITNLRFILSNYGNKITKAKWPSVAGGNSGFKKLVSYADENDIVIYPDYDFANVSHLEIMSGFSLKKYAAQTMSGRYTTRRDYDPVYQTMNEMGKKNVISAGSFDELYKKFSKTFLKFKTNAISLMSIGTDLNSDFNEDAPITREDSKYYTEQFLSTVLCDNPNILVSAGNAYVYPYVTDIVDIPLDNSRYSISTASVPFAGMVLHGYVNYAGTAVNMAGDVQYQVMKSIENGAAPYYILSYENTEQMKDSEDLSAYYSVNFGMWLDDVKECYSVLNGAIGSLQNATITSHEFEAAFRADEKTAAVLFGTYNELKARLDKAQKEYKEAVKTVDQLTKDQKDPTSAIVVETEKLGVFNAAKEAFTRFEETFERRVVDNVVSVTYTSLSGNQKTFYINYNSFDVVISADDGTIVTLAGLSFAEKSDIDSKPITLESVDMATAFLPKTSERNSFEADVKNLAAAELAENANQIARYREALDKLEAKMTAHTGVFKITDKSGYTVYINTSTDSVIVKIGDYDYITLARESYYVANN